MRHFTILLTAALLALGAGGVTAVKAEVQLGDLLKKAAGKEKSTPPAKASRKKGASAPDDEKGKSASQSADSSDEAKRPATGSSGEKVDRFIDRNNDGIDDRRQSKVKREEPRPSPAPSEDRARRSPSASPPDSSSRRPPR